MEASGHRFSWIFDGTSVLNRPRFDEIIYETSGFVVVPSLGSLVPGWLLVIPKRPLANLSLLKEGELEELDDVTNVLRDKLKKFPGHVYSFEHGGGINSTLSCGVDQAHLHVVPLQFDFVQTVLRKDYLSWKAVPGLAQVGSMLRKGEEYLFMSADDFAAYAVVEEPISQWFRKEIAEAIGVPDKWDYKKHPNLEVVNQTLEDLVA